MPDPAKDLTFRKGGLKHGTEKTSQNDSHGILMVGAMLGFGYGMSTVIQPHNPQITSASTISETPMVPANFSNLPRRSALESSISR